MYWYRGVRCKLCKKMIALKDLEDRFEQFEADVRRITGFTVVCPHCSKESLYAHEHLETFPTEDRFKSEWRM